MCWSGVPFSEDRRRIGGWFISVRSIWLAGKISFHTYTHTHTHARARGSRYSIDADAELAKALAAELNAPVAPPQPSSGAGFFNSLINGAGGAGGGGGGHRRYGIEKDTQPPNKKAIKRMQSDLTALYRSANPLMSVRLVCARGGGGCVVCGEKWLIRSCPS